LDEDASNDYPMEANMPETYLSDRQLGARYNVHYLTPGAG
jgi:hypothetical protein